MASFSYSTYGGFATRIDGSFRIAFLRSTAITQQLLQFYKVEASFFWETSHCKFMKIFALLQIANELIACFAQISLRIYKQWRGFVVMIFCRRLAIQHFLRLFAINNMTYSACLAHIFRSSCQIVLENP